MDPNDTMTIDQLIDWAEDKVREAAMQEHPAARAEYAQESIAYSLVAIAKMMRQDRS